MKNLIELKTKLSEEPMDYQMSVILQNMIATWGQERVTKFMLEVFEKSFKEAQAKKKKKVA